MSQLRKIVEKKKCEKYAWPEGWMTRTQAADDLGVAPRDVDDTLKEAVRDGDVEKQFFQVYDARQGRVIREPGYRVAPKKEPTEEIVDMPADKVTRILAGIGRNPGATNAAIARKLYNVSSREVGTVRAAQAKP